MKTAIKVTLGTMLAASVAAPAQANFWNGVAIYGAATYTEATNNAATMGMTDPVPQRHLVVEPGHELDYSVGISLGLGASDTRVFFDYDHFNSGETRSASALINLGVPGVPASGSQAVLDQHAEQFRLGLAHTLHFGPRVDFTLNGFLDYTKLDRDFNEANGGAARSTFEKVKGFGPGFGANLRAAPFATCPEFGVFAGLNTSLLYTNNEYRQSNSSLGQDYSYNPEDSHSMIVKLDSEFGIDYRRVINSDMARFLFKAELGMRYMNVINAFKSGNTSWNPSVLANNPAVDFAQWTGPAHDFGRVGPFLRITIGGAGA